MSFPYAAGALYSTVEDLFRWDQAMLAGRLIAAESHARMTTVTPLLTTYGYGVGMGREFNRRTVGHAGGIHGFRSHLIRYPDEPACAVALSNSEEAECVAITKSLSAILFGEKIEAPAVKTPIEVPADRLAAYAGDYEIVPGIALHVESGDRRLIVTSGAARARFLPESETVFYREESPDTLSFHVSGAGSVSHVTLKQGDVEVVARRL
jgi:hypothetical protein